MPRRSPIWLLASLLALVSAVALLGAGNLLTAAPLASDASRRPDDGGGDAAVVRGFYDAVNALLRTGQPTDLDRLLAANFVAHAVPVGLAPTRAGFVRSLRALHATFPGLQLRAEDVVAAGDVVVAHVRVDGAAQGSFLGLPLAGLPPPWGEVDVFRLAAGVIVEHWGSQEAFPLLEPLQQAQLDVGYPSLQTVSLVRTTVVPGGSATVRAALDPQLLYLEGGRLTVSVDGHAADRALRWRAASTGGGPQDLVAPGSATTLAPGDLLLLPAGLRATTQNRGDGPAAFLAIALRMPGGSSPSWPPADPPATPGVTINDLAGSMMITPLRGQATLALGRATLAPGTAFPIHAPGETLLAIEAGDLRLAMTEGMVLSRRREDGSITTATDGNRGAGHSMLIGAGALGELRNAGDAPLVLLVLTMTPAD